LAVFFFITTADAAAAQRAGRAMRGIDQFIHEVQNTGTL